MSSKRGTFIGLTMNLLCMLQTAESEGAPFSMLWVALEYHL